MTWNCHACTYGNINDSSTACHMCQTERPGGQAPPAIVDLTEICSPKPTDANGGHQKEKVDGGNKSMESNRSRRRRMQDEGTNSRKEEELVSSSRPPSSSSADNSFFRQKERAKRDTNDMISDRSSSNADYPRSLNRKSNLRADTGSYENSKKSNNINNSVIGMGNGRQNISDRSSTTHSTKPCTAIGGRSGCSIDEGRKKTIADEDDVVMDPTPRRELPLNMNGTGFEPGKRKGSKLKKRKVDVNMNSQNENDAKMRSVSSSSDSIGGREHYSNQKNVTAVNTSRNARNDMKDTMNPYKNDDRAMEGDFRGNSSNGGGSSDVNARGNRKRAHSSSNTGKARLNIFYNQQNQPQASAEELMGRANDILQQTFGHNSLRPLQETAVKEALKRNSQIVIMATGGGKSMCYQLPALAGGNNSGKVRAENSSVTIVVCPLIALMIDQVNNLHRKGVHTAACLSSTHSAKAKEEILHRLQTNRSVTQNGRNTNQTGTQLTPIQLLYCTPELIETERFRGVLSKLYESNRLHMLAIDEAHCLSTWGHDFRPAFRKLTWVRDAFPDVPIMACTGTATAKVIQDIRDILRFDKNVPCIMGTFNRPNLSYEVRFKDSLNTTKPQGAMADLVAVVKKQHSIAKKANRPCSGICYVHKRDDCQSLALQISKATGLVCLPYHAGIKDSEREETQRKWTDGRCSIAVATVAFGMGIDLPHVRYVIHWTMAKSLEGFYQESGRGGRDGKPSLSILYYSKDDASRFAYLVKLNAERAAKKKGNRMTQKVDHSLVELEKMTDYCTQPICKRKFVLEHFGEKIDAGAVCNKTCDYCQNPQKVGREIQAAECMSAVANSHRLMHHAKKKGQEPKKFHHNPLDDEESLGDHRGSDDFFGRDEGLLGITNYTGDDIVASGPKKGFVKASSVLNKFDTMECQQGKKGGFVNFKSKTFEEQSQEEADGKKHRAINIPEHLRKGAPDPLAGHKKASKSKAPELKSSSSYASEAEKLKAELEELKKQREAALAKMGGSLKSLSSRSSYKPLPPPSLLFKKRRY